MHGMCTYSFGRFRPQQPTCCCSASDVMTRMTHLRLVLVRRSFGPSKTIKNAGAKIPRTHKLMGERLFESFGLAVTVWRMLSLAKKDVAADSRVAVR